MKGQSQETVLRQRCSEPLAKLPSLSPSPIQLSRVLTTPTHPTHTRELPRSRSFPILPRREKRHKPLAQITDTQLHHKSCDISPKLKLKLQRPCDARTVKPKQALFPRAHLRSLLVLPLHTLELVSHLRVKRQRTTTTAAVLATVRHVDGL